MSSRKVVINGVTYIRSRDAARAVNLALDYVSRLARHGVISGKRVSGIWFVDPFSSRIAKKNCCAHASHRCAMKSSASPDNLGALFTHDGIAETIYSTSTVHVNTEGTTTIDYWAVIPSSQEILHAPRDVVVHEAANDNATIAPTDASTTPPRQRQPHSSHPDGDRHRSYNHRQ
jgi:hypothetical protein